MVLKSFAKINLTLKVKKKLPSGLHDIETFYCLVNNFASIKGSFTAVIFTILCRYYF